MIRATEISKCLSGGKVLTDGWLIEQLKQFAKEFGPQIHGLVTLQIQVAEVTALGIWAAVATFNDMWETWRALVVGQSRSRVVDTWATNVDVVASGECDDLVDEMETCAFDKAKETSTDNGFTWDRGRLWGAACSRGTVLRVRWAAMGRWTGSSRWRIARVGT